MRTLRITYVVLMLIALIPCKSFAQNIWGVTKTGGAQNTGTTFRTDIDGNNHVINGSFGGKTRHGLDAAGQLVLASDNKLYGVTRLGGTENNGTLYQIDPATDVFTVKYNFSRIPGQGGGPTGKLTQIGNKLYGMTQVSGTNALGSIFSYDLTSGVVVTEVNFPLYPGPGYPNTLPTVSNNKIYGTSLGGLNNNGTLWEFDPATATLSKKVDFDPSIEKSQITAIATGPTSNVYFTTLNGTTNQWTMYEYVPGNSSVTTKFIFPGFGFTGQVAVSGNKMYGVIYNTGIYEFDLSTNVLTAKYAFTTSTATGSTHTGLFFGPSTDRLFGTATGGGNLNNGMLFEYNLTTNTFTKRLESADFIYPKPGLAYYAANNTLYGANAWVQNGTSYYSRLFKYNTSTAVGTKIMDFVQQGNVINPSGEFSKSSDGYYYGVLESGGADNVGGWASMELLDPNSSYPFNSGAFSYCDICPYGMGSFPEGGLTLNTNGRMYGISSDGSTYGNGTIYEVFAPSGPGSSYFGGKAPFAFPHSVPGSHNGLTLAGTKMYGLLAKWDPATAADGVIYETINGSAITIVHTFSSATTGTKPLGKLTLAGNGLLYGVASAGGANNVGTIFEFNPTTGTTTKRHDFNASTTGSTPIGNLFLAQNGKLYGMASLGGANNIGTLYEFDPTTYAVVKKYDFTSTNGSSPVGNIVQSSNGKLYGTTPIGGTSNLGVLFEYDLTTSTFTKKLDFIGTNGANPSGLWFESNPILQTQTVTLDPLPGRTWPNLSPPVTLNGVASSGLPVTYTTSDASVISISGNVATYLKPGSASIGAVQAGNATYARGSTSQYVYINKAIQNYTWIPPAGTPFCATGSFDATLYSSSGVPPRTISNSEPSHVSIARVGTTDVYRFTLTPSNWTGSFTFIAEFDQNNDYYVPGQYLGSMTINAPASATITGSSTVCAGVANTYTTQTGKSNYVWTASGGTITGSGSSVSIAWATNGSKTFSVSWQEGTCTSTVSKTITVNSPTPTITGQTGACIGATKGYSTTAVAGATYLWSVSAGGSIMGGQGNYSIGVIWSTAGSKTVTLTQTVAGCSKTVTYNLTAGGAPTGSVTTPDGTKLCPAMQVRLVAPAGTSWLWSTGETTQTVYMTAPGSKTVQVTNSFGCTASFTSPTVTRNGTCQFERRAAPEEVEVITAVEDDQPLVNGEVTVSPVPADKHLIISFPTSKENFAKIRLIDVTGKLAVEDTMVNANRKELDVTNYANGLYILVIETPTKKLSRKVMIRH